MFQIRIGEASTPGPCDQWGLGVVNVNGINGKAAQFSDLPAGIYAVSESHLTTPGQFRFKDEIRSIGLPMQWSGGAPAPFKGKSLSSIGGKHTGVGFMTSFPYRPVTRGWQSDLFATGRIHAASFHVGSTWITGGVCYGYAWQSESQQVKDNTHALLSHLVEVVMHGVPGPKFIAGDFNQLEGQLPITQNLEQAGWQEIQNFAFRHWQVLPGPTCQHKTRKDFLYISPELQQHVLAVSNEFDRFPDHSTLLASMSFPCPLPKEPRWHKVVAIDYHSLPCNPAADLQEVPIAGQSEHPSDRLSAIFQTFENQLHHHCRSLGHQGLHPTQLGRASSFRRSFVCPSFAPLKKSRPGEPKPGITAESLKHKRWFTQLRRLVAYRNLVRSGKISASAQEHKVSLWRSIVHAPGFNPSFPLWWQHQGYPRFFTFGRSTPPCDLDTASQILATMELEVRNLEALLQKARQAKAKKAHMQDVNRIFREVRKPGPAPVQALVAKQKGVVIEAPDAGTVVIQDGAFDVKLPLYSPHGVHHAHMIEDGQIWFDTEHSLVPGDILVQIEPIGSIQALHTAFEKEWTTRWDRHRDVPFDTWDPINDLASELLPSYPMQCCDIQVDDWIKVIRKKKLRSAIGMDSISKQDLLALPNWIHQPIVDLVNNAEHTGQWPRQMVQGSVHALEKCAQADEVTQFRPITVMPLMFRCWGTFRAKQVLAHITRVAPPELVGNIPGRTATSLWWKLQAQIEQSLYSDTPCVGYVADLVKAFNLLPRDPVFNIAIHIGIAPRIVRAWAAAVTLNRRHFYVRGCPGPGLPSSTGFPEGCAMSVTAMCLLNLFIHRTVMVRHPQATFSSYVDNLEIIAHQAIEAASCLQTLTRICHSLDLMIDDKKTYAWATHASDRATFRASNIPYQRSCRDLGGHLQYGSQRTNSTVVVKCKALMPMWSRLSRSQAPLFIKRKILRTVAWPGALHSASIVHLNANTFDSLRSGAMQALRLDKAGANPQLQLALIDGALYDPEFWVLLDAVTQLRRHGTPALCDAILPEVIPVLPRRRKPGPFGVLVNRLQALGFRSCGTTLWQDFDGSMLDIFHSPIQEVKLRLSLAWTRHVGRLWQHRKGFQGLESVDAKLSAIDVGSFTEDQVGFLRVLQNGTVFTNDVLVRHGVVDGAQCRFCNQLDSVQHRHWHCSATKHIRSQLPSEVIQRLSLLPLCAQSQGWFPEPVEVEAFRAQVLLIPDVTGQVEPLPSSHRDTPTLDLFTDGAAIDSKIPSTRLVSWGVILAGVLPGDHSHPIAAGGVPGLLQTVGRAELCGIIAALKFGHRGSHNLRIWCDNHYVVNNARRIMRKQLVPHALMPDHDLWSVVEQLITSNFGVSFVHVASHQSRTDIDDFQQWAFDNNDQADALASRFHEWCPNALLAAQQAASQAYHRMLSLKQSAHQHYVRVAEFAVTHKSVTPSVAPVASTIDPQLVAFDVSLVFRTVPFDAPNRLRFEGWTKVIAWLEAVEDHTSETQWVSLAELLWSFQLHSRCRGVLSTGNHCTWKLDDLRGEYDAQQSIRSFGKYVVHLIQTKHPTVKTLSRRPRNFRFQMWTMCLPIRFASTMKERLQQWMASQLGDRLLYTIGRDVVSLPPAVEVDPHPSGAQIGLRRFCRSDT